MLAVSADASAHEMASSFGQGAGQAKMLHQVRDELLRKLTSRLIERLQSPR